jgi:predicted RNA binding protein YcfA (HicA-like mRNA interferase family)
MPKAARVLAALKRDDWVQIHQKGSHRRLEKAGVRVTFAFHNSRDLGNVDLVKIASNFGYTLDELRELL